MHTITPVRWLLALLLALGSLSVAQATHLRGGDITYATIASTTAGVPRYHVVVRNFAEPNSPAVSPPSSSVTLTVSKGNCSAVGANKFTVQALRSQLISSNVLGCSSSTSFYQIAIYEVDVDLPIGQWVLSSTTNARAAGIQNIANALAQNTYLSAYLDNAVAAQDASPVFQSMLQPIVSTSALTPYSMSAFDADGDSLSYELILPAGDCNISLPTYPSNFAPHYTINADTGVLTPTPAISSGVQGYYNITVRVSEYRKLGPNRWTLIGSVIRDTLYLLYPSTNQPPTFTTMQVNGGAAQPLSTSVAVQPGQTVSIVLQATDPDVGQLLRFASAAAGVVPGLSLTQVGTTTSAQLTWQVPTALPAGRYLLLVSVFDNGCPYNGSEERSIQFVVSGNRPLAIRANSNAATDIYPTPFRDQVQFKTAPNQGVVLFDALGREVARLTSAADGQVRWLPSVALPAGLYLARSAADGQPLARLLRAE